MWKVFIMELVIDHNNFSGNSHDFQLTEPELNGQCIKGP